MATVCLHGSFRCAYGACISKTAACNHLNDCRDGSDELASICSKDLGTPWHLYPWQKESSLNHLHHGTDSCTDENSCKVFGSNLRVKTIYNGLPYLGDGTVPHQTTVRLSCGRNYLRQGSDMNTCDNGEWKAPWAECIKGCKSSTITNDRSIRAICTYEQEIVDCSALLHPPRTVAITRCAQGYRPSRSIDRGEIECKANGNWRRRHAYSPKLKCVPDCGRTFDTVKDHPLVVSVFRHMGYDRHVQHSRIFHYNGQSLNELQFEYGARLRRAPH
ncbi:modular serine protease isoform X2 [Drosophila mojavensis]|nr:modular serine protease isoform X2 [Drosophila mojavensis]